MRQALITMLDMQHRMNTRVHPQWQDQGFAWYRAIWIECAELLDHYGYKWWKKQTPDMPHVQLEVIDIWHFGLSALLSAQAASSDEARIAAVADQVLAALQNHCCQQQDVRAATEALAQFALSQQGFSVTDFWDLMTAVELDFDQLHRAYVGKNVLNFFRQDNGYQEGTYRKNWQGQEDNEHLMTLMADLDSTKADFADAVYQALSQRYQALNGE